MEVRVRKVLKAVLVLQVKRDRSVRSDPQVNLVNQDPMVSQVLRAILEIKVQPGPMDKQEIPDHKVHKVREVSQDLMVSQVDQDNQDLRGSRAQLGPMELQVSLDQLVS